MHLITAISSFSAFLPAIAAIFFYRRTPKGYFPLFLMFWIGVFNEMLSHYLNQAIKSSAVNGNIYVLIEGLLLLWLFKNWGRLNNKYINLPVLAALFLITWGIDNFILNSVFQINSLYRCVYAFTIVFLALDQINFIVATHRKSILKESTFLLSVGFVMYFFYKVLIESFYLFDFGVSKILIINLYKIMQIVNLVCNIIFTIAILWIKKRQTFTLAY